MKPEINLQTKYTTRDGRAVELKSCDHNGTYSVSALINDEVYSFTEYGKYYEHRDSSYDLIEAVEATPRNFGDMADAEKGALLLAQHEGKGLEHLIDGWRKKSRNSIFNDSVIYRVSPTYIKGTVKVDAEGNPDFETWEAT